MDLLEVLRKAETEGGKERRASIEKLLIAARDLGCNRRHGGGTAGGVNIRFGSIGYSIVDIKTSGLVKLYVQPHPNKEAPDFMRDSLNEYIGSHEVLETKSFPFNTYGHLEVNVEDIPEGILTGFIELAVGHIQDHYYLRHAED